MKERSTMMQAEEVSGEERKSMAKRRPTPIQNQSQSQIIWKNQQKSTLVEASDPQNEFGSGSSQMWQIEQNLEEESKSRQKQRKNGMFDSESRLSTSNMTDEPRNLRTVQSQLVKKGYKELTDLKILHNFPVSEKKPSPIWVVKFRQDGKYLATGGLDGVLRVYQMQPVYYNESKAATLLSSGKSHRPKPFKEFENGHQLDIFDIAWCPKD